MIKSYLDVIERPLVFIMGLILFLVGIYTFVHPEALITKNTPKYHPLFSIKMKKYYKIRAPFMVVGGLLAMIFSLT